MFYNLGNKQKEIIEKMKPDRCAKKVISCENRKLILKAIRQIAAQICSEEGFMYVGRITMGIP